MTNYLFAIIQLKNGGSSSKLFFICRPNQNEKPKTAQSDSIDIVLN